jgi:hypothetical protein
MARSRHIETIEMNGSRGPLLEQGIWESILPKIMKVVQNPVIWFGKGLGFKYNPRFVLCV